MVTDQIEKIIPNLQTQNFALALVDIKQDLTRLEELSSLNIQCILMGYSTQRRMLSLQQRNNTNNTNTPDINSDNNTLGNDNTNNNATTTTEADNDGGISLEQEEDDMKQLPFLKKPVREKNLYDLLKEYLIASISPSQKQNPLNIKEHGHSTELMDSAPHSHHPNNSTISKSGFSPNKLKILVAEDNQMNQR